MSNRKDVGWRGIWEGVILHVLEGSSGKEPICNGFFADGDTGDRSLIPGLGRSPGGGHGNPLQYPCLENPMEKGAWWAKVHGVVKC